MKSYTMMLWAVASLSGAYANPHNSDQQLIFSDQAGDKFVDVIHYLIENSQENCCHKPGEYSEKFSFEIALNPSQIHILSSKKLTVTRNYHALVTPEEKSDLAEILHTLARNSLPSLATSKSHLKKTGERIDHLHPLRFLMTVFTDEELKADISAIRRRGWVWDKFYDGLEGSMKEESRKDNMRIEDVIDFANTIGIDAALIQPAIQEKRWKDFINTLIENVPRSGNPGRYDM